MKWVNVFTQVFLLLAGDTSNTTAQKMKFSIKYFLSKCDRIRSKLRLWSHLLKKALMENFIFCAVYFGQVEQYSMERLLEFAFILNSPYLI